MQRRLTLLAASLLLAPALVTIPSSMAPAAQAQTPANPVLCSGIQLQNTTNTTANVTLNFIRVSTNTNPVDPAQRGQIVTTIGGPGSPDGTLGPNVSRSYPLFGPRFSGIIADGMYSVVVNADQPLNALVNQQTCTGSSPFVLSSFRGSGSADVGTNLILPFVLSRAFPQLFSSYIAIQNAGNAPATVQIAFFPQGSSAASQT
ncbi:MAG: hypothetical protein NZ518_08900, partial [Dehalococcoidia bacterium]|nr:hypothetical protein [Dehalococcoidia bacterium]